MPSNNGNYTLPPIYYATPSTEIKSAQHNGPFEDVAVELNATVRRDGTRPMQASLPMGGNKITGLGDATAAGDAVTFGQSQAAIAPGVINMFGGSQAPSGSLLCNGAAYSRTAYPALFAAIGTTYGAGDGANTFNVPNLQGRVPVGAGAGYGLGATGGAATVALTEAQMPSHQHGGTTSANGDHQHESGVEALSNYHGGGSFIGGRTYPMGGINCFVNANSSINGRHDHSFVTDFRGSGQAHNNMQPYVVINYIIKT